MDYQRRGAQSFRIKKILWLIYPGRIEVFIYNVVFFFFNMQTNSQYPNSHRWTDKRIESNETSSLVRWLSFSIRKSPSSNLFLCNNKLCNLPQTRRPSQRSLSATWTPTSPVLPRMSISSAVRSVASALHEKYSYWWSKTTRKTEGGDKEWDRKK